MPHISQECGFNSKCWCGWIDHNLIRKMMSLLLQENHQDNTIDWSFPSLFFHSLTPSPSPSSPLIWPPFMSCWYRLLQIPVLSGSDFCSSFMCSLLYVLLSPILCSFFWFNRFCPCISLWSTWFLLVVFNHGDYLP